jgi:hypothetical protein
MASVYTMSWRTLAAVLIAAAIITPAASQGNQFTTTVVTLLSGERGIVDERAMATKDIVPHVVSLRGGRAGMHMVTVETCPKVPPETIQAIVKDLQNKKFVPVIDLHEVHPRICLR